MKAALFAQMHEAAFVPGICNFGPTLDPAKMKGLKMHLVRPGVMVEYKGKVALIPYTMFKTIELDPKSLDDSEETA